MRLRHATLGNLPDGITGPSYDPGDLQPGVLHLGMGNFHRAHQGVYLDRIASAGDMTWGIVGVGFRAPDRALNQAACEQEGLYTLETVSPAGESAVQVMANVMEHIYAPDDAERLLDFAADPRIRIISLTITEGGYGPLDHAAELDPSHPGPLGTIVLGAARRKAAGAPGFTVLSCDNIEMNGALARKVIRDLAKTEDDGLVAWIDDNVTFPSGMVDRITPVTTEALREQRRSEGLVDAWPVRAESYLQWVLEDDFAAGRPDWGAVGVQLVDDVRPYEKMKLRLLNASHQVLSHLGLLEGLTLVDEVVTDPDFSELVRSYMDREARPTLDPVPGIDLDQYSDQLMARFAAKATEDTLARQVVDASERIQKFVIPVLEDQLVRTDGKAPLIDAIVLTLAAWYGAVAGSEVLADQNAGLIRRAVAAEANDGGGFLTVMIPQSFASDHPLVKEKFAFYRDLLERRGPRAAAREALARSATTGA